MDRAKRCVSDRISSVSNFSVLDKALDYYLKNHSSATTDTLPVPAKQTRCHKPYLYSKKSETGEEMVLCTLSALKNIICGIQEHSTECDMHLQVKDETTIGHVKKICLNCTKGHTVNVDTSPHIEGGQFLVNMKIIHAVNYH